MQLNELSLFSGYGGLSLGLRLANLNVRTVAYVEWEKYPQEIIKARIKDGFLDDAPIFGDVSAFRGKQFRGLVDILTAGFPCQPHSVASSERKGASDDRNKWPDTLRIIREVRPRYVILENVPGISSASKLRRTPNYGAVVVGELASEGYVVRWETLGAIDISAPHRRKRWWCIGVLADSDSYGQFNQSGSTTRQDGTEGRKECSPNSEPGGDSVARERVSLHETGLGEEAVGRGLYDCEDSTKLGDSDSNAAQGMEQGSQQSGNQRPFRLPGGTSQLPVWPPSPNDPDGWEQVIRERPDLAPAITKEAESEFRGVADGATHRVDRLKATGNGVVPSVVAEFLRIIGISERSR